MFQEENTPVQFSQVIPDISDGPPTARISEQNNLTNLDQATQTRLVTELSRLLLFKALSGEPIDRTKLAKEAWGDNRTIKVGINAVLDKAVERMKLVWGMDVKRLPEEQMKLMPNKFKERMYVVNRVKDDGEGIHSKALHSVHLDSAIEKGLLMLILAFVYCKGEVQDHMRWITVGVLYRLLHSVDENIPAEPLRLGAAAPNKRESIGDLASPTTHRTNDRNSGIGLTPDVDTLLEKFVHLEYLLKKKADKSPAGAGGGGAGADGTFLYAIGPRALLEVGRRQIIYFCAELLDEQPDPTMLQELADEEKEAKGEDMEEISDVDGYDGFEQQ